MDTHQQYAVALAEARSTLRHQAADIKHIRWRVLAVLALSALVAFVANHDAGYAALVVVAGCALFVHWPVSLLLIQDGAVLVEWVDYHDADPATVERELAVYMNRHYEANKPKVDRMYVVATAALGLVYMQTVVLLVGRLL